MGFISDIKKIESSRQKLTPPMAQKQITPLKNTIFSKPTATKQPMKQQTKQKPKDTSWNDAIGLPQLQTLAQKSKETAKEDANKQALKNFNDLSSKSISKNSNYDFFNNQFKDVKPLRSQNKTIYTKADDGSILKRKVIAETPTTYEVEYGGDILPDGKKTAVHTFAVDKKDKTYNFDPNKIDMNDVFKKSSEADKRYIDQKQQEFNNLPLALKILDRVGASGERFMTGNTDYVPEFQTGNKVVDKVSNVGTSILGGAVSFGVPSGGTVRSFGGMANSLGQQITNKLPQANSVLSRIGIKAAEGAATMLPFSASSTMYREDLTPQEKIKKVGEETLAGGIIGGGLGAAGEAVRGVKGLVNAANNAAHEIGKNPFEGISDVPNKADNVALTKIKTGNYQVKNVSYENTMKDYNAAIEHIQNTFGAKELRADEIPKAKEIVKQEIGIDLDTTIKSLEKYESLTGKSILDEAGNKAKYKRIAGLSEESVDRIKNITQSMKENNQVKINEKAKSDSKDVSKMTQKQFDTHYGLDQDLRGLTPKESTIAQHTAINKILSDSGKRIVKKLGTSDLKEIANHYVKKYELPQKIDIYKSIKNSNKPAQIGFSKDPMGNIKKVSLSINPNKPIDEVIGAMRHEIEHYNDIVNGYKPIEKNPVKINPEEPKTIRAMYEQYTKGHHKNYGWFEPEYLFNAMKKDAAEVKLKPPETVKTETPTKATKSIKTVNSNIKAIESIERVEQPKRPLRGNGEQIESGWSKNIKTDLNTEDSLRKMLEQDPIQHAVLKDKDVIAKAQERFNKGYEKALSEWRMKLDDFSPDDVPLARMLAKEAAKRGDLETSRSITADIADKLTQSGQYARAAKLLRSSDPSTFVSTIEKQIYRLNKQGKKVYGNKWNEVKIPDKTLKEIYKLELIDETQMTNVYRDINSQLPVTKLEKFDAWRRMAMLLNPKTHIRNIVGNVFMMALRKSSDTLGAALEKTMRIKPGERTKSFLWSKDKNIVNLVNEDWGTMKNDLISNGRYDIESVSLNNQDKRIFKNNVLEALNVFSKTSLNAEDVPFLKRAYKDALGQYLKSNRLTEVTEAARAYAKRRAYEATYKQANIISETLSRMKSKPVVGKLTDALVPFSKTPSNILMRTAEYSPVGLLKTLYSKQSGKSVSTVIEDLSKGITGTGLMSLGFLLANMGWARGQKNKSKNAEGIESAAGQQPYSINTPLGNYTFDWAQPGSVPLAMGVAIHEELQKDNPSLVEAAKNSIIAGGDTIFNMSMLKSIKDTFRYNSPSEAFMQLPVSYIEQAFPTISGQLTRIVDTSKRNTYNPDSKQKFANQFLAKTPFASKLLEPKIDVFGKEMKNGNVAEQLLSPGYYMEKKNDVVSKEVLRLYEKYNNTDFLPKTAEGMKYKFTHKNQQIQMTPKEATQFQKTMGKANYDAIKKAVEGEKYKTLTDEQKMNVIKSISSKALNIARIELLRNRKSKKIGP